MKRMISLVLSVLFLLCVIPTAVHAEPAEGSDPAQAQNFPSIIKFNTAADGVRMDISPYKGAAAYRVFELREGKWRNLGVTKTTSFTHKGLKNNTVYTYTVRALDASGAFYSDYDRTGWSWRFFTQPTITAVQSAYNGMKISWNPVKGVSRYRIYVKNGSSWKKLSDPVDCTYTDTAVTSSNTYTYTVRCLSEDEKMFLSFYDTKGKSAKYFASPRITSIENLAKGSKITWSASKGVAIYRVFMKNGSSWKRIADTKELSYTHTPLKNQQEYIYTVRAVDQSGKFISSYNTKGWSNRFLSPPTLSSVKKDADGMKLSWNAVDHIKNYRVYRKKYGEGWQKLADITATSYVDTNMPANFPYTYTFKCLDDNFKPASSHVAYSKYFVGTALAKGTYKIGSQNLYFENGALYTGYRTLNGKTYYYKAGVLQKNGIVGSKAEGFCYASKDGSIDYSFTGIAKNANGCWYFIKGRLDFNFRGAVTYQSKDWNVLNGKATQVKTEKDKTLFRALKLVSKITTKDMTKEQKLKKCFNHIKTAYTEMNPRIPHYRGMDWPVIYANDIFVNGKGNCISYAAAFGFLAKAIGYDNVYGCHSGGHGWCEINGLIYDPEWSTHSSASTYYGISYDTKTDVDYRSGIAAGYAWMHVKI